MPKVHFILDVLQPEYREVRAERTVELPGVPSVGDPVDLIPGVGPTLTVTTVRWHAIHGTVTLFLGLGADEDRAGVTKHGDAIEIREHLLADMKQAGWRTDD